MTTAWLVWSSVSLGGLGTPTFAKAILAAKDIHKHFDRQFAKGILEPWTETKDDKETESIDLSNRYLTPVSEAGGMENIDFLPDVDPKGILRDLARADGALAYIHTEDNQVSYYDAHRDTAGNRRYERCSPQSFRIGDIVQAQVSFMVIPIRGRKRKTLSVLQSIALLDGRFAKVNMPPKNKTQTPAAKLISIKRRVGYQESDNNRRKDKMVVDEAGV